MLKAVFETFRLLNGSPSYNKMKYNKITGTYKIYARKPCIRIVAAHTCLCDVSEYLWMADSKLFNRTQSPSHCLSHLLPPEKHHLGLRPREHSYDLPICPNNLCKRSFIPRSLFCFLWPLAIHCFCYCISITFALSFVFINKEVSVYNT